MLRTDAQHAYSLERLIKLSYDSSTVELMTVNVEKMDVDKSVNWNIRT